MTNPYPSSTSTPGRGLIELRHVPPASSTLGQVSYQYPLKLVAPAPLQSPDNVSVQTVYLLTYGGGLVAGDTIDLDIKLASSTRLILLTQGSTKIFKSPSPGLVSTQATNVTLAPGAALCYLPDPVQPFAQSAFTQRQAYNVQPGASLCALDWVCRGRAARGEDWNMSNYESRNDVWAERRLLLRDNLVLRGKGEAGFADQMHGLGVYGTLILHGPAFEKLADWFRDEFKAIPRIGGRRWDGDEPEKMGEKETWRAVRRRGEAEDGLLWTVATLRGCTVGKFGTRDVEGGKKWLRVMLEEEGSVVRHFGARALLCLK